MANQAFLSANGYLGLIAESTRGTLPSSGTPAYIPVSGPQVTPTLKWLDDNSLRGSAVMTYDSVAGVRNDDLEFKSYLYADTFGNLIRSVLGGTDSVTGSSVYTHSLKLLNSPTTGSQPPSYSVLVFDGANYFTVSGAQADSLALTFGADTTAEATQKFVANPYVSYTSAPTPFSTLSLSTEHPIPAWNTTISVNGTTFNYISSGELTITRNTKPIFTEGTQGPYVNFAGPIEVTGKFTGVVATTSDPWSTGTSATALNRNETPLVITFTDPNDVTSSTNHSIAFTMSATQFFNPKRNVGKEYTEVEVEFKAIGNTTDAASGYAPIQATLVNAQSASY